MFQDSEGYHVLPFFHSQIFPLRRTQTIHETVYVGLHIFPMWFNGILDKIMISFAFFSSSVGQCEGIEITPKKNTLFFKLNLANAKFQSPTP